MVHSAYPSHRFHPSFDSGNEFAQVEDEDEDQRLLDSDELWRDVPYSDAERAEWKAAHPKAAKARKPQPMTKGEAEVEDVKKKRPPKPRRIEFKSKADHEKAVKAWNEGAKQ